MISEILTSILLLFTPVISFDDNSFQNEFDSALHESVGVMLKWNETFEEFYVEYFNNFNYSDSITEGNDIQNVPEFIQNNYSGTCRSSALYLFVVAEEMGLEVEYVVEVNGEEGHAFVEVDGVFYDSTAQRRGVDVFEENSEVYYYGNL